MDAPGAFKAAIVSALVLFGSPLSIIAVAPVAADELTASALRPTPTTSERDQLYAELAADVYELEQRGSIVKRVVKLATPAVVHIEARRDVENARPARGESEEAGSGVIIERRGRLFVL